MNHIRNVCERAIFEWEGGSGIFDASIISSCLAASLPSAAEGKQKRSQIQGVYSNRYTTIIA